MKRMLFNATHPEETRVGIVDGQKLIDIDIETAGREARKSNIYKGVVTRIEPSLEACFINYGEDRHGFLPFKEISRAYFKAGVDVRTATIREAITEGQELIVQVEKEERGNKGAALTTFISLAGRYLVLMPNNPRAGGVSRRIEGEERQELREAMEKLDVPTGMSTIARTAGIGRTTEELQWDLNYLLKLWEAIVDAAKPQYEIVTEENGRRKVNVTTESVMNGKPLKRLNPAPFLIVEESNLVVRAIRDYFQPEIGEILVDTDEIYEQARQFMAHVMPDMIGRVKRYRDDIPLFTRFQIEQQIETAYSRTVPLPSGGAIVIDHTEALVAIDVNSARATRGADIEETAFRTNCEAADEVARQMRLRDLGGLIVIDFIDMADPKNQRAVEQRLKDAIRFDRARVQIAKISRFGLMELSRQRLRPALSEGSHITCPRCNGVGVIRDTESCAIQVLRILQEEAMKEGTGAVEAQVPVDVATFLLNEKRVDITKLEARHRVPIILVPNTYLETPHYHIERIRQDDERLEKHVASFNLVEEIETRADDPYAQKSAEEKPARSKQEPVIKNIMIEREPAPVHVPKEEKAALEKSANRAARPQEVTPKKGLFARIAAFLFGSSEKAEKVEADEQKKAEDSKTARSGDRAGRRGNRRGERTNRGRRDRSVERLERADRQDRAAEEKRAEKDAKEARQKTRVADAERTERVERQEKTERVERAERTERAERNRSRRRNTRRTESEAIESAVEKEVAQPLNAQTIAQTVPEVQSPLEAQPQTSLTPQPVEPLEAPQTIEAEQKTEAPLATDGAEAPVAFEENAERKPRRRSRRRRTADAAQDGAQQTEGVTESVELALSAEGTEAAEKAEKTSEGLDAAAATPSTSEATVEEMRPTAVAQETDEADTVATATEQAEEAAEEGARRRRPRRRRRSRNAQEGDAVQQANSPEAAEAAEAVETIESTVNTQVVEPIASTEKAEVAAATEAVEKLIQIETKPVEAAAPVETVPNVAIDPVEALRAEVASHQTFGTFQENNALVQIETKPSAVSMAVSQAFLHDAAEEPAKKERRRRARKPKAEAPREEKLIQIETKKPVVEPESIEPAANTADSTSAAPETASVDVAATSCTEAKSELPTESEPAPDVEATSAAATETIENSDADVRQTAVEAEPLQVASTSTLAVAAGLAENLARAGLIQVHTRSEFDTKVSYAPVVYSGRPRAAAQAADDEGELVQVHTRPELVKPVVYEAVRYPGRCVEKTAAEAEGPLVQVETKKA